jgi:hypothetical protein
MYCSLEWEGSELAAYMSTYPAAGGVMNAPYALRLDALLTYTLVCYCLFTQVCIPMECLWFG